MVAAPPWANSVETVRPSSAKNPRSMAMKTGATSAIGRMPSVISAF